MRTIFRLSVAALLLILSGISAAHADEFRGLYVDAFHPGFKTRQEVTQMVNAAKAANFNALIVQVRKRGNTYYNSRVELMAHDVAADYDPLADIITQANAVGMEVHAWLSVYEVTLYRGLTDQHITKAHPDWLMADRNGKTKLAGGKVYTDPGVPAVREHFLSMVREILQNYNVDGIHLDNVRYPDTAAGYNATSIALYTQQSSRTGVPDSEDEGWCTWRRKQITALVRTVHDAIMATKPSVKLSASVMTADPETAAGRYLQDWGVWTREGLLDFAVSMIYIRADKMSDYAPKAVSSGASRHVYVGIGAYRIPPDLAKKHIADARAAGAQGLAVYSYYCMGPGIEDVGFAKLSDLAASVFASPEAPTEMPWKD